MNMHLPLEFWEVQVEEVGSSRAIVNKLPSAPPTKTSGAPLRRRPGPSGCVDLNLTQHPFGTDQPTLHTLPAQKQMNRLLSRANPLLRSLNRAPLYYRATARMDYSSVPTPERCYADFCLVPVRDRYKLSLPPPPPNCCSELSTP